MKNMLPLVLLSFLVIHYLLSGYREYREFGHFVRHKLDRLPGPGWRKWVIHGFILILVIPVFWAGALYYAGELSGLLA